MKKKLITMLLAMALTASMLSACGGDKAAETTTEIKEVEEADASEEVADEDAADEDAADESSEDGSFSLLDVSEDMVDVGAYGMSDDGVELVFTMFTGPDGNNYVSLIGFNNNSNDGDVICGQYEATTETDEDGDEWTNFIVSDVYTEEEYHLGVCERPETEQVAFYDKDGTVIEGQFLSAADTIKYMGSAAALLSGDAEN